MKNRVEQWQFWVLGFSGEGPPAPSRAVETLWAENWAATVAKRDRPVYAATRSGPKMEIPAYSLISLIMPLQHVPKSGFLPRAQPTLVPVIRSKVWMDQEMLRQARKLSRKAGGGSLLCW